MRGVIEKRQQAERQGRIEKILQAGRKLFLEKGYFGATVRDIALEAEFSTGVIYFYFKGKDEIYGRICEEGFQILFDLFSRAARSKGSPLERLIAVAMAYVEFFERYPDYFDILSFRNMGFKQVGLPDDILRRLEGYSGRIIGIGHDIVTQGMEEGYINPDLDSWETAFSLWASIEGIMFIFKRKYFDVYGLDVHRVIQTQINILMDGIRRR